MRVVAPMIAIETVAAGGGSICTFDGAKLVVGPNSAGADPGPACYGRGGPLAVTDVNFYLGKILPEHFPFPLDRGAVETRLAALIREIEQATSRRYTPVELCDGFLQVANANMIKAIQSISIAKGCDPASTFWSLLVARRGSTPAPWPTIWEFARCCYIPMPAFSRLWHRRGRCRPPCGPRSLWAVLRQRACASSTRSLPNWPQPQSVKWLPRGAAAEQVEVRPCSIFATKAGCMAHHPGTDGRHIC